MNSTPNKLMPWLQAIAALIIIVLFCTLAMGPMFGFHNADDDMKATLKDIMLILTGFLFGSSANSAKKDEQNAALAASLVAPTPPVTLAPVKVDDTIPIKVSEVPPTA